MVGYADLNADVFEPVPAADLKGSGRQLYRITTTWVSDGGASRIAQPPAYLYVTPQALKLSSNGTGKTVTDGTSPGCPVTPVFPSPGANPFGLAAQSYTRCWSRVNSTTCRRSRGPEHTRRATSSLDRPGAGRGDRPGRRGETGRAEPGAGLGPLPGREPGGSMARPCPVLASSASGMNEYAQTTLQQLAAPSAMPDMDDAWKSAQASAPGQTVATVRTTAQQAYSGVLNGPPETYENGVSGTLATGYWSLGPVDYQRGSAGALTPRPVVNPPSVWYTGSLVPIAMDDEGSQYRTVTSHVKTTQQTFGDLIKVGGVFDPDKIKSFSALSQVPLGDYQPVAVTPADRGQPPGAGRERPAAQPEPGRLVSQPVNLVTTLSALPALENSPDLLRRLHASDPISVIRVRVAGVTGAERAVTGADQRGGPADRASAPAWTWTSWPDPHRRPRPSTCRPVSTASRRWRLRKTG